MTGAAPAVRVPRYLQVSAALQRRIEAGDYPLGALLPTEIELSEAFAVNRHTVRDALRRLADAGFVQRRQGSGSQVVSLTRHRAYAGVARELTSHGGAIYRLIEQRFGVEVVDVEQEITAAPMPVAAARAMAVSPKPWAVRVVRRYRDAAGGLMLVSVNHHSADRFSHTMHLRRDGRNWG